MNVRCRFTVKSCRNTYEDDLEEHLLVNLHKLLVPLLDVGRALAGVGLLIVGGG
jgi:hypothetical protein